MTSPSDDLMIGDAINTSCPWSGKPIADGSLTLYRDAVVGFCNPDCRDRFEIAVHHFEAALQAKLLTEGPTGQGNRG